MFKFSIHRKVPTVKVINKVSQKPNNPKRSSWRFEKEDYLTEKNNIKFQMVRDE